LISLETDFFVSSFLIIFARSELSAAGFQPSAKQKIAADARSPTADRFGSIHLSKNAESFAWNL
jgi:hypothetical protein